MKYIMGLAALALFLGCVAPIACAQTNSILSNLNVGAVAMPNGSDGGLCYFCKRGHFVKTIREMAFHQWTDKGYIFCRVEVPLGVCDRCGSTDWTEEAEAIVETAVRREYERLP